MKRNTNEAIGMRILAARKKMGYSQEELSFLLKIKKSTLCKYENGNSIISAELLGDIAFELNETPEKLIFGEQTEDEWITEMLIILKKIKNPRMRKLAQAQLMCMLDGD